MAVNVTQKDKTLQAVLDHIVEEEQAALAGKYGKEFTQGRLAALVELRVWCEGRLGYSGDMPNEVPNQSERV